MSSLVYRYALSAPDDESSDRVFTQLRAAHAYHFDLLLIERGRRAAIRTLLDKATADQVTAVMDAEKLAELAGVEVRAARAKDRTLKIDTTERDAARERAKQARGVLFQARKAARLALAHDLLEIDLKAKELKTNARTHTLAYWGTYLLIEEAVMRAAQAPLYAEDGVSPNDPRLPRWDGSGTLGVQLQGGLSAVAAMGRRDTRLRIHAPPPAAWYPNPTPNEPRNAGQGHRKACKLLRQKSRVQVRIGSDGRAPIWAAWEMDMHRALPEGATIKWATVHRVKKGPFFRWHLCLTLSADTAPSARGGAVAVDVGWRLVDNDLRVCRWYASDGAQGELRLSEEDIRILRAPEELRSARDSRLESLRMRIGTWLRSKLPEWLMRETETFHAWRAPARFVRLLHAWREARFDGDEIAYSALEAYCAQDLFDWRTETSWRTSALDRRRNLYRQFAAKLASNYGTSSTRRSSTRRRMRCAELRLTSDAFGCRSTAAGVCVIVGVRIWIP